MSWPMYKRRKSGKKLPEVLRRIRKTWKRKGSLRLMFQDEARFGRITESRRCWCPKPERPVCPSMICREYIYAYGAVNLLDGQWDSLILPYGNTSCMPIFLDEIAQRYATDRIVMVMDGAGWHKSSDLKVPKNMRLLLLPPHSPELNPVENIWEDIREKYFHNRVFPSLDAVEDHLLTSLKHLEDHPEITHSISSWDWIINAIPN
ncbi:MAG: IS630 family transposase [Candidatus Accumulibacter sp.]|nr:IS630 family transposase [Accumulibacter sp.]